MPTNEKRPDHGPAVADEDPDYSPMDKPAPGKPEKKAEKEQRSGDPRPKRSGERQQPV